MSNQQTTPPLVANLQPQPQPQPSGKLLDGMACAAPDTALNAQPKPASSHNPNQSSNQNDNQKDSQNQNSRQHPQPEAHVFRCVCVALPVPLFDLFDYYLPDRFDLAEMAQLQQRSDYSATHNTTVEDSSSLDLHPLTGFRIKVPFGKRTLIGIVVGWGNSAKHTDFEIKTAEEILDTVAVIPTSLLKLLQWAASYYHYPLGEVIATAMVTLLRQGKPLDMLATHWRVNSGVDSTFLARAPNQKKAYDLLNLHDQRGAPESALLLMGVTRKQLQQLEAKKLASHFLEAHQYKQEPVKLAQLPLIANTEQQNAIHAIVHVQHQYHGFLLDGLTGSGKTEVYLQAMQPVLEAGQQVLILVPEIGLTPQTISRFKARFHAHIVMMHSSMTDVARLKVWQAVFTGQADIVLGTRSSIFLPMPRLGLIIVDEEHDVSYKQQDTFRYHAKDLALVRGQLTGCPVVLGSATPCLESLQLVQDKKLTLLRLTERAGVAQTANMQLIDLRGKKRHTGLSTELVNAIVDTLAAGNQVLIFLNRRGYAPVLVCVACGWQADCPRCDAHLTYHQLPQIHLHCHHCGYISRVPSHCAACHTGELTPSGIGTARLDEWLRNQFENTPIIRVDRDTTKHVGSWDHIYAHINKAEPAILVGTQMLAKGHHFPHVTLVAILDTDGGFLSADFRAPERTAQLIMQVAGRAGRGDKAGKVLIQTWQPNNPLLLSLLKHGYADFAQQLLTQRFSSKLPPCRYSALIRAESMYLDKVDECLNIILESLKAQPMAETLEIWGPIPAPMQRRADVYRKHVYVLSFNRKTLHQILEPWWIEMWQLPNRRQVRISLDIDPQEFA